MKSSFLTQCALAGVCLPLLAGCVRREVVYSPPPVPVPAPTQAPAVVEAEPPPPPPPQTEVVTAAPGPLAVWFWTPGMWEWNGRWVWVGGHWLHRPHPGAEWVSPHWEMRGRHRVWVSGRWR